MSSLSLLTKVQRLRRLREASNGEVEQQVAQYNPYGVPEDFKEFAKTCQIRSGTDFVPFDLFDYQQEISRLYDKCKGLAVLKTRQTGFSELTACKMLHRSLLNPAYLGVAFSLGQNESSKLSDRVGLMPSRIPGFKWVTDSKTARKSDKGGELLFRPSTPNAARSLASVTDLFLDECGFPPDIEEMYGNATPAQSMVGAAAKRVLGTTLPVEGLDCWFGQVFWSGIPFDLEEEIKRVQEGRGRHDRGFSYWIDQDGWCRILLHWQSHPIYSSIPNYLEKIKQSERITEAQLQREHNLGLPKSGSSLFNLDALTRNAIGSWQGPDRRQKYLMGVDPNFGGSDPFTALIFDVTQLPFSLVCEYREANRSTAYSRGKVVELIRQFRPLYVAVEGNAGGVTMAENIMSDCPTTAVEIIKTTSSSKIVNTDRVALAVEQDEVIYPPDWHGIKEMKKFSAKSREGINETDDCVMAMAAAWTQIEKVVKLIARRKASVTGMMNSTPNVTF